MKPLALKNNMTAVMASALILGAGLMFLPKVTTNHTADPEITRYTNALFASVQPIPKAPPQSFSMPDWDWYWNEQAQIDLTDKYGFYGNDIFSEAIENVTNSYLAPTWNSAMQSEFIRGGLLVLLAGMIFTGGTMISNKVLKN